MYDVCNALRRVRMASVATLGERRRRRVQRREPEARTEDVAGSIRQHSRYVSLFAIGVTRARGLVSFRKAAGRRGTQARSGKARAQRRPRGGDATSDRARFLAAARN